MKSLITASVFVFCGFASATGPKQTVQRIDVPFAASKRIVTVRIVNEKLGSLGKCESPGSKKMVPCAEPSWPGKCSLKEAAANEVYEINCVSQEGTEPLLLSTIERIASFKFPTTIVGEMQATEHYKDKPARDLSLIIKTKSEKWGKIYSWTTPTSGARTYFYICPAGPKECFRATKDGNVEMSFSTRRIVTEKL